MMFFVRARCSTKRGAVLRGKRSSLQLLAWAGVCAGLAAIAASTGPAALALAPPGASHASTSWLTYGFNAERTGYNPAETVLGPSNVGRIHRLWRTRLGDVMIAQPVEAAGVKVRGVATNVVYEGTERGKFYALNASDGHVIWDKNLGSAAMPPGCPWFPGHVDGIGGAGAISFTSPGKGVVYVAGGDGAVHALDLATGAEERRWPVKGVFNPSQTHVFGGLNLFNGRLYVTDAGLCDIPPYHGGAVEINVPEHRIVHHFYPAGPPSQKISGGGIWGYGGVSIDPTTHDVFAATGNALTEPENYLYSDAVVKLDRSLGVIDYSRPPLVGTDVDFGSTPVLFRPAGCRTTLLAAKNKSGVLFTYKIDGIKSGPLQRLQVADVNGANFNGVAAWDPATNMLYVSNSANSSDGPYRHGMVALKAARDCKLRLAWQREVGRNGIGVSSPTVANGVVYYADGRGDTEDAFNARTGKRLWHSRGIGGAIYAAPTIINGKLLVGAWDGYLYAYGVRRSHRVR